MVGGAWWFERPCSEEFERLLFKVLELFGNLGKGIIEGRVKSSVIQVGPKQTFIMQLLS